MTDSYTSTASLDVSGQLNKLISNGINEFLILLQRENVKQLINYCNKYLYKLNYH